MAATTGSEAYEARKQLTPQVSRSEQPPTGDEGSNGGERRREKDATRAQQGPLTPPRTPEARGDLGETEFRRKVIDSTRGDLLSTAQIIRGLRPQEYTPAACALIRDAFGRVPGYIQMLDEHMAEEKARSRALEARVKELEGSQKQWSRGQASWAQVAQAPGQRDGSTLLQGNQGSINPTGGSMNMKKLDGTKMRRVTVRIRDESEKE
ncbi:MAG: hypothetical protein Q9212_007547, partial [Teloschistes hypoglaucus]